ncbi:MAG: Uma2 family endonuclease [Chthoniobacterales bacterium]
MASSVLSNPAEEAAFSLRRLTVAEYHRLGESGVLQPTDRVELFDGLLIQMAPIGPEHQFIQERLNEIFGEQKKGRFKVGPGRPIPIPDFNELQPDLVLFTTDAGTRRQHILPQQIYLVVEVSDTSLKYDSEKKLQAYQSAGIPEYWIIDLANAFVRVFRLNANGKYEGTVVSQGIVAFQAFPDVEVRLQDLF